MQDTPDISSGVPAIYFGNIVSKKSYGKIGDLVSNIILAQKKLLIEQTGSIGEQMLAKNLTPPDCTVIFDMQEFPFSVRLDTDISLSESDKDCLSCVYLAPVFNGETDEQGNPEIVVLRRTFDISGMKYGGDIAKDLQNKLLFL